MLRRPFLSIPFLLILSFIHPDSGTGIQSSTNHVHIFRCRWQKGIEMYTLSLGYRHARGPVAKDAGNAHYFRADGLANRGHTLHPASGGSHPNDVAILNT